MVDTILIGIVLLFVSISLLLQLRNYSFWRRGGVILDSSTLIDGRILDIVNAGFITQRLIVPKFIVAELQRLADSQDHLKRARARFGLDNVKALQESRHVELSVVTDLVESSEEVDERLVKLAVKRGAKLLTTDFNLLKVAQIHSVQTMNINALAQSLRPTALPGEEIEILIVQRGSGRDQGVGYLDDGTMVVVSHAHSLMKKTVKVLITRTLQTEAGRMLFAELTKANPS